MPTGPSPWPLGAFSRTCKLTTCHFTIKPRTEHLQLCRSSRSQLPSTGRCFPRETTVGKGSLSPGFPACSFDHTWAGTGEVPTSTLVRQDAFSGCLWEAADRGSTHGVSPWLTPHRVWYLDHTAQCRELIPGQAGQEARVLISSFKNDSKQKARTDKFRNT